MKLSDCTKADLLWVIEQLCDRYLFDGEFYLERTLSALSFKKEQDRLDQARKYAETTDTARKRWVDLMAPYDGWRIIDIPIDVIQQADAAMQEAKAADNKWRQLMGF